MSKKAQVTKKFTTEIQNYLNEVAELAASKAVKKKLINRPGTNYYKLTEKLLYQYNDLRSYIEDEEWYIESYLSEIKPRKSKDIVVFSSARTESVVESTEMMRQKAKDSLELTKQFMARIDKALERLDPEQADIIHALIFLKNEKAQEVADRLHCDITTVRRKRNKSIEKMSLFLFGSVAIDI